MAKDSSPDFEIDAYIHSSKEYYEKLSEPERKDFEKQVTQSLMRSFTRDLQLKAARFLEMPRIGPLPLLQKFMQLVPEVIMLYTNGYYYSAVASCGVAAERVCYDILETADMEMDNKPLTSRQKSQICRMNFSQFVNLLLVWGLIKKETAKLLEKLRLCRNRYIHPSFENTNAKDDSIKMIRWLFRIVEIEFGPGPGSRYVIVNGKIAHVKGRRFWNSHKKQDV
jgi:hypothetical protein